MVDYATKLGSRTDHLFLDYFLHRTLDRWGAEDRLARQPAYRQHELQEAAHQLRASLVDRTKRGKP